MDKSMKLMFGAMTVAICLMAFNMVGGKSPEANASMNAGYDYRGGTEPTIVWYGTSLNSWEGNGSRSSMHGIVDSGMVGNGCCSK